MAAGARATAFVTGAAGFIGMELVRVLAARGHRVVGLARSAESAARLRSAGAAPIMGDLLESGLWQDEASADWVFHLPPHPLPRCRLTPARAASIARARVLMDAHLLDAVARGSTDRIVYVADARCYGATGRRPITEDEPPKPSAWGRSLMPALDRLEGYVVAGLPIVTAMPGRVYGNGSWFREHVVEPVLADRRVWQSGNAGPWISLIHVHDCARALVHLAEQGEVGGRYFLANDEPVRMQDLTRSVARLAGHRLRECRIAEAAARFAVGMPLADANHGDAVLANIRLRGIGFRFEYPTVEQGLQQVLGVVHE